MSRRRPSEVITSLRFQAEEAKQQQQQQYLHNPSMSSNHSRKTINSIIKVDQDARFCPSGHCFSRVLLTQRRREVQEEQNLPISIIPPISCSACSAEITTEYIAACCKSCDIDICDECFESGMPIEELMMTMQAHGRDLELDPTLSMSMSEMTMSTTDASCSFGHPLRRVLTARRKRYIQERDGLDSIPSIECDCCSRVITSEFIAGCCVQCDIDFCENCFQSGLSFEEVLQQEPILVVEEKALPEDIGGRYNGRRPTYKRSGRVSYDDYPDPSAFQWQFTGSCEMSCVEYFEKDFGYRIGVVKLDFFYAKGKVRTVLEHPRKGTRPLFTKDNKISSNLYRKILLDPRQYAQKSSKKQVL